MEKTYPHGTINLPRSRKLAHAISEQLLDLETLDSETPPADAAIDFVLPRLATGECGLLVGESGAGKTQLALQLAVSVAVGRDLTASEAAGIGISTTAGQVAFIELEEGRAAMWHRMHVLYSRLTPDEKARLKTNLKLYVSPGTLDMLDGGREVAAAMADGSRLVVIDSLACAHSGDENDTAHMNELAMAVKSIAASTGAAIVLLHHTTKAAIHEGRTDGKTAARGATAFVNAMRWQSNLVEDKAKDYRRFCISIQHYGPRPADTNLVVWQDGTLHCVAAAPQPHQKPTTAKTKQTKKALPSRY